MAAVEPPPSKRHRHDEHESSAVALYVPDATPGHDSHGGIRMSSLASPTMKLSGHKGSVYCLAYDPLGEVLCSGSFDSTCLLWNGKLCAAIFFPFVDDVF